MDERALRTVSDPLFIERSSRRLGSGANGGMPRIEAGLEDEDIEKEFRGGEMVGRKLSEEEGVLRVSSGFDQRTVNRGTRRGGVVGG